MLHGLSLVLPFRRVQLLTSAGSSRDLAALLHQKGWRRLLLVTDQCLMQLQLSHGLIQDLERSRVHLTVFDQLPVNPTIACVEDGLGSYRAWRFDSLIAFI